MRTRTAPSSWLGALTESYPPSGCSTLVLLTTVIYLAVGFIAFVLWRVTGNIAWVNGFFQVPGALLLVGMAAIQTIFSYRVVLEFAPGEPLRTAWTLIATSAGCDFAGGFATHILASRTFERLWDKSTILALHQFGFLAGGSVRFVLLAAALFWTLKAYRAAGFLSKLAAIDWILLAFAGTYILLEFRSVVVAFQHGKLLNLVEILGWPTDPALWLLLAETLLLFRSMQRMGLGLISRCWRAFAMGVALVVIGNCGLYTTNYGYLPWPWSALTWYVWLPAAGVFALAPLYQLQAILQARGGPGRLTGAK